MSEAEQGILPEHLKSAAEWRVIAAARPLEPGQGLVAIALRNGPGMEIGFTVPLGWPANFEDCDMEAAGLVVSARIFEALSSACRAEAQRLVGAL